MKEKLDAASKAFEPYRYYSANNETRQIACGRSTGAEPV
jgi:hypothetical protein